MTRPTKEQVEHCLKHTEGWQYLGSDTTMPGTGWEKFEVLAAEVRALREESQRLENRHVEQRGKFKEALESNEAYRVENAKLREELAAVTYSEPVEGYALVKGPNGTDGAAVDLLREFGRRGDMLEAMRELHWEFLRLLGQSDGTARGVYAECANKLAAILGDWTPLGEAIGVPPRLRPVPGKEPAGMEHVTQWVCEKHHAAGMTTSGGGCPLCEATKPTD